MTHKNIEWLKHSSDGERKMSRSGKQVCASLSQSGVWCGSIPVEYRIWMRLCQPGGSRHVSPLQTLRWLIWDTCKHLTAWVLWGERGRERLPNLDLLTSHHHMALGWNLLIPLQGDRNTRGQYRPYTWLQLGRVIHTRLIPKIKATYFIATITPLRTTKYGFKESLKMCTFNIWRVNIWILMPSFSLYWHLMRNMKKNL